MQISGISTATRADIGNALLDLIKCTSLKRIWHVLSLEVFGVMSHQTGRYVLCYRAHWMKSVNAFLVRTVVHGETICPFSVCWHAKDG